MSISDISEIGSRLLCTCNPMLYLFCLTSCLCVDEPSGGPHQSHEGFSDWRVWIGGEGHTTCGERRRRSKWGGRMDIFVFQRCQPHVSLSLYKHVLELKLDTFLWTALTLCPQEHRGDSSSFPETSTHTCYSPGCYGWRAFQEHEAKPRLLGGRKIHRLARCH